MLYNLRCQTFLSLLFLMLRVEAKKSSHLLMPIGVHRALARMVYGVNNAQLVKRRFGLAEMLRWNNTLANLFLHYYEYPHYPVMNCNQDLCNNQTINIVELIQHQPSTSWLHGYLQYMHVLKVTLLICMYKTF